MRRIAALASLAFLAACAAPTPQGDPLTRLASAQWPEVTVGERVQFINGFSSPSELGYRPAFSARFRQFLGGGRESRLVRPYAVDQDQRWLVIADPGAGLVYCLDKDRRRQHVIGNSDALLLSSPVGVALTDDHLYVADSALGKVFKFDHGQRLVATLESFERPTALAWDRAANRLYVTDTAAHHIKVFDGQDTLVKTIGERGAGTGQFNYPAHIALSGDRLLVVDSLNFRVQMFSLEGEYRGSFGIHGDQPGYLAQPKGIATDSDGHVYIAESVTGIVQVFDIEGRFLLAFGGAPDLPGGMLLPAGIHIEDDRIYVADSGNGRIQVFRYLGVRP